jgi:uncharacterized protein (DUF362 family)
MTAPHRFNRRQFVHTLGFTAAAAATQSCRGLDGVSETASPMPSPLPVEPTIVVPPTAVPTAQPTAQPTATPRSLVGRVALVNTDDRAFGVRRALDLLEINPVRGKRVLIKPNYNTADPAPSSTQPEVLRALARWLWESAAETIAVGDRSGMGNTRAVMERVGTFDVAQELGLEAVVFDELGPDGWAPQVGSHWSRGFALARPVLEAESVVLACCLKTHRFGGHFTLSLKNAVGMVAKRVPGEGHNYMTELHNSADQRKMIAEVNAAYRPDLAVIDGVEAFATGGPEVGAKVRAQVVLAGADRVALDAVGVALLRYFGTTEVVAAGPIFQQEQIARAVELGLGVSSAAGIELITGDPASRAYAELLEPILTGGE